MSVFTKKLLPKLPEKSGGIVTEKASSSPPSPPPKYRVDQLPEDDLVASIRGLNLSRPENAKAQLLPSNDECIAHLKVLASFANLREETSETDGLFGLSDNLADRSSGTAHDELVIKIREKRWAVFVTRAVDRFQQWWEQHLPKTMVGSGPGEAICMRDILQPGTLEKIILKARQQPLTWTTAMLPPLDVLMVLHSFMLNPRDFLEDCIRHNKLSLWSAGFPWALVNESIDNETLEYRAPGQAMEAFNRNNGPSWVNLEDPMDKTLACCRCQKTIQCKYTDASVKFNSRHPFEAWKGFADKAFEASCSHCGHRNTHDSLRKRKFRSDVLILTKYHLPMPGTLLSLNGLPESAATSHPHKHEMFFPNRLILAGLEKSLLEQTDPKLNSSGDFDKIRSVIQKGIADRSVVTKANQTVMSMRLKRGEKIAIRRMMSRYWENSSPFALDLVGAVLRQGVFVEKMKALDWIHSPALESTVTRLIKKYTIFFQIMAENPGHIAVPTLDVDLAWHTQQLSPALYFTYAVGKTKGTLIDHDDKIEENKLSSAFEWTSKRYQKLTGGDVYSECTCWYCEAIRESHNHQSVISSGTTSAAKSKALNLHDRKDINSNPDKNPHISAHNAVKTESTAGARIAARQQYKLERDYEKAVRRAQGAGKTPPTRDAYAYSYVWGYPMYMPMYYPYASDPCISGGMYACDPTTINTTPGAAGNCAAGSCGGTVAAGGCASAAGGCGGAAAGSGGCGGGGGGGGGCGGGGGGGGGCGGGGGA